MLGFITPEKRARMEAVLARRTRYISVVLEDIYQTQNASAVLRSCECFGVQDLSIIENHYKFSANVDVTMGAHKWLTLQRYHRRDADNVGQCISRLRENGYRIVATALSDKALPLHELPLDQKTALCFGTEEYGLSEAMLANADAHVVIPMQGFTQSFNISVSAAICLYHLRNRLDASGIDWSLSADEQQEILFNWLHKQIRYSHKIVKGFLNRQI